jgi:hypothetical protein
MTSVEKETKFRVRVYESEKRPLRSGFRAVIEKRPLRTGFVQSLIVLASMSSKKVENQSRRKRRINILKKLRADYSRDELCILFREAMMDDRQICR